LEYMDPVTFPNFADAFVLSGEYDSVFLLVPWKLPPFLIRLWFRVSASMVSFTRIKTASHSQRVLYERRAQH
jgi:hypothetical protein